MLLLKKLGIATAVLAVLTAWFALGNGSRGAAPEEPRAAQPTPPLAGNATPQPRGPNRILVDRAGQLTLLDPDGKNEKRVDEKLAKSLAQEGQLSPDGKKIAFLIVPNPPSDTPGRTFISQFQLCVRDVDGKGQGTDLGSAKVFVWSPDGTEIAASDFTATDGIPDKLKPESAHFIVNVRTQEKTTLKLPDDHMITDWSRDGKYFVTTRLRGTKEAPSARVFLMNRDGTERKALTDEKTMAMGGKLSPDGKQMLYTQFEWVKGKPPTRNLMLADLATGKAIPVEGFPGEAELQSYCWSPDGKRIAYTWRRTLNSGTTQEETEAGLVVCEPDGKNDKAIVSEKHPTNLGTLMRVDWR